MSTIDLTVTTWDKSNVVILQKFCILLTKPQLIDDIDKALFFTILSNHFTQIHKSSVGPCPGSSQTGSVLRWLKLSRNFQFGPIPKVKPNLFFLLYLKSRGK